MALKPLHDRVLVRRVESDEKTAGGLIIPDSAKEKPSEGEVIACGEGARKDSGELIPMAVAAGDIATTIFHPVGTVKMGHQNDPTAVLDPHLRMKGVAGLRVVDASIMPEITSGNTNSPTIMIAEKAARWMLDGQ